MNVTSAKEIVEIVERTDNNQGAYSTKEYWQAKGYLDRHSQLSPALETAIEALDGLIKAVLKDSKERNEMGGYTFARLSDAKEALSKIKTLSQGLGK